MPRKPGTLKMGSNMEPKVNAPLDSRTKVLLKADLIHVDSFPYWYIGMQVFVEEEMKRYTLIGEDTTDITNWKVESQGGGGSDLQEAIEVTEGVGGIETGAAYAAGDSVEDVLRDLLNPLKNPTFTPPSASLSITSGNSLAESGSTPALTLTATLNRGKIEPPYGTSGKRSGEASEYSLNDGAAQAGNVFNVTASESNKTFQATIWYGEGEQPKNSHKQDYDSPLPASSVKSNTISIEFVDAIWDNTGDISTVSKGAIISKTTKSKQFNFPPCTAENPEIFDIPASWAVSKVEVLSELSGKFEDCASEFSVTDTTHQNAAGENVAYKRYTDNRGYNGAERTIKVTWS